MKIAIRPPKPVTPTAIEITVPRVTTEQGITGHQRPADAETKRSWRASGGRLRERWLRKG